MSMVSSRVISGSFKLGLMAIYLIFFGGCAVLHHAQFGDLDTKKNHLLIPFELKVSETGVDLQQGAATLRSLHRSQQTDAFQKVANIIALFQMGPRTGGPVYDDTYADGLMVAIYEKCQSGEVTGLSLIRETNQYPAGISGEIVKIKGLCQMEKTERKNKS